MSTQPNHIKITPVYASGRIVGKVQGREFCKVIQFSKHALRKPPALALSSDSLLQAENLGATSIKITDMESGRVYSCSIEHFRRYAFDLQRGGFENQKALPLDRWDVTGGKVARQTARNDETFSKIAKNAKQISFSWGK